MTLTGLGFHQYLHIHMECILLDVSSPDQPEGHSTQSRKEATEAVLPLGHSINASEFLLYSRNHGCACPGSVHMSASLWGVLLFRQMLSAFSRMLGILHLPHQLQGPFSLLGFEYVEI